MVTRQTTRAGSSRSRKRVKEEEEEFVRGQGGDGGVEEGKDEQHHHHPEDAKGMLGSSMSTTSSSSTTRAAAAAAAAVIQASARRWTGKAVGKGKGKARKEGEGDEMRVLGIERGEDEVDTQRNGGNKRKRGGVGRSASSTGSSSSSSSSNAAPPASHYYVTGPPSTGIGDGDSSVPPPRMHGSSSSTSTSRTNSGDTTSTSTPASSSSSPHLYSTSATHSPSFVSSSSTYHSQSDTFHFAGNLHDDIARLSFKDEDWPDALHFIHDYEYEKAVMLNARAHRLSQLIQPGPAYGTSSAVDSLRFDSLSPPPPHLSLSLPSSANSAFATSTTNGGGSTGSGSNGNSSSGSSTARSSQSDSGTSRGSTSNAHKKRLSESHVLYTQRLKKRKISHRIKSFLLLRGPGLTKAGIDGFQDLQQIIQKTPNWLKNATSDLSRESRMKPNEFIWSSDVMEWEGTSASQQARGGWRKHATPMPSPQLPDARPHQPSMSDTSDTKTATDDGHRDRVRLSGTSITGVSFGRESYKNWLNRPTAAELILKRRIKASLPSKSTLPDSQESTTNNNASVSSPNSSDGGNSNGSDSADGTSGSGSGSDENSGSSSNGSSSTSATTVSTGSSSTANGKRSSTVGTSRTSPDDSSFHSPPSTTAPMPITPFELPAPQPPPPSVLKAQLLAVLRSRLGTGPASGTASAVNGEVKYNDGTLRMKKFVIWNAWMRRSHASVHEAVANSRSSARNGPSRQSTSLPSSPSKVDSGKDGSSRRAPSSPRSTPGREEKDGTETDDEAVQSDSEEASVVGGSHRLLLGSERRTRETPWSRMTRSAPASRRASRSPSPPSSPTSPSRSTVQPHGQHHASEAVHNSPHNSQQYYQSSSAPLLHPIPLFPSANANKARSVSPPPSSDPTADYSPAVHDWSNVSLAPDRPRSTQKANVDSAASKGGEAAGASRTSTSTSYFPEGLAGAERTPPSPRATHTSLPHARNGTASLSMEAPSTSPGYYSSSSSHSSTSPSLTFSPSDGSGSDGSSRTSTSPMADLHLSSSSSSSSSSPSNKFTPAYSHTLLPSTSHSPASALFYDKQGSGTAQLDDAASDMTVTIFERSQYGSDASESLLEARTDGQHQQQKPYAAHQAQPQLLGMSYSHPNKRPAFRYHNEYYGHGATATTVGDSEGQVETQTTMTNGQQRHS